MCHVLSCTSLWSYFIIKHISMSLFVSLQALLVAIFKSPQQLADLPAEGDPLPGAPARAQSSWEPTGGALC